VRQPPPPQPYSAINFMEESSNLPVTDPHSKDGRRSKQTLLQPPPLVLAKVGPSENIQSPIKSHRTQGRYFSLRRLMHIRIMERRVNNHAAAWRQSVTFPHHLATRPDLHDGQQ